MADGWTGLANSTSHLPALGMGMIGMKERNEDRDVSLGLMKERADANLQLGKERNQLMQQQRDIEAQKLAAQTPKHKQPMNPSMVSSAEVATGKAFGKDGVDVLRPLFDMSREVAAADPGSTFGDNFSAVKSAWPTMREEIAGSIQKKLESGKLNPDQQKKLSALYDSVMYDKDGSLVLDQGVYKNTASSIKMEEENSKASLLSAREEGKNERAGQTDERIRQLHEENLALKRDREIRLGQPKPEKPPKPPTTMDIKRVKDMISTATKDGRELTPSDIETISAAADKVGMEYRRFTGTTAVRGIPGTTLFDMGGKETEAYHLVPKDSPAQVAPQVQPSTGAPKVGEVRKGYKFKGGDPSDQNSWEKI